MSGYRFLAADKLQSSDIAATHESHQLIAGHPTIDPDHYRYNVVARAYTIPRWEDGLSLAEIQEIAAARGLEIVQVDGAQGHQAPARVDHMHTRAVRLVWQGRLGPVIAVAVTPYDCPEPAELRAASDRIASTQAERDALIDEALTAGMTQATVAGWTGLTRGRINQLAQQR